MSDESIATATSEPATPTVAAEPAKLGKVTLVHVLCLSLIVAMVVLSATLFKNNHEIQTMLVGGALWLWGNLGFVPNSSILKMFLQKKRPTEIAAMAALPEPMRAAITVIQHKADSMRPGAIVETAIPVKIVGNSQIPREFAQDDQASG